MSILRVLIIGALALVVSTNANSTFINYGVYTTDDDTNLNWLHLDQTQGQYVTTALSNNPDWRYATVQEINHLYNKIFTALPLKYNNYYEERGGSYLSRQSQFATLFNVLGTTFRNQYSQYAIGQIGDTSGYNLAYAAILHSAQISMVGLPGTSVNPPSTNRYYYGTYLVQDTIKEISPAISVPEPTSLALIGLGIAGLGFARRSKQG
ncbi:MAG: hypothetical protein AMJ53_08220 [Gammaproteobacteria bacterium SG8_11]|nr:MAG: hypothetical protein AMJ53_08220 [Gammaproteobacteria bacterium SG8_11]